MIIRQLLIMALVLALGGCGFNIRGSQQFGSELVGQLFIVEQGSVSVLQPLRNALTAQQVRFATVREDADTVVELSNENISRRVASVSASGRVSEYELLHSVGLRTYRSATVAADGDAAVNSSPATKPKLQTVSVARDYTYDETDVLAKDDEERILRAEMSDELVRHLVLVIFSGLR